MRQPRLDALGISGYKAAPLPLSSRSIAKGRDDGSDTRIGKAPGRASWVANEGLDTSSSAR